MSEFVTENIKAVLFDFDDTLVGTHKAIWNLHKHIAQTYYEIELTDEKIAEHWGRPIGELARHYYNTEDIDAAVAKMIHHQQDFKKETFVYTVPTLQELKLAGKLIGIVSATTMPIMKQDTEWAGLPLDMFDYLQTAEATEHHKPDPHVFDPALAWASTQNITAAEMLYVGDGLQDLKAARGAGINFMGVQSGLVTAEDFATHAGSSIIDLSHLLKRPESA